MVYASMTHQYIFNYKPKDIYWCTADIGWITGHSYIIYGPLANGATTIMFEGIPTYPDASRFWQVCEKHKVNQFLRTQYLSTKLFSSYARTWKFVMDLTPCHS